ncbi:MAG TPA: class I SAM-dependent methyltransferase [Vicinamibacterales bacterium]
MSGVGKVTGFLSRLAPRRAAEEEAEPVPARVPPEPIVPTKALKKFIASLRQCPSPTLLDLGPVVGSNIQYFGERLGCKVFIEDIFADLDRFQREHQLADLPAFLRTRFPQAPESVDGILCWDLFDFMDKPSARVVADHLMRVLKANGALLGFFATAHPAEATFTKFIVVDDGNLRHRPYSTPRMRQAVMQNRDIIKLFERLRVSDSFLLHTNVREILFRKPGYLSNP